MRIGLVGYGTGGQHFHAPFIAAAEGVELAGVVARAPATIARIEADLPGTPIYPSLAAMIAAGGLDAVTVTTPPQTRRALVLEAIDTGLNVIADKLEATLRQSIEAAFFHLEALKRRADGVQDDDCDPLDWSEELLEFVEIAHLSRALKR